MTAHKTKQELIEFIKNKISYDSYGGRKCPHCQKEIEKFYAYTHHKEYLATSINDFLGFIKYLPSEYRPIYVEIHSIIDNFCFTGKKEKDSIALGNEIYSLFWD